MINSIIGIILGYAVTLYCMVRSWQCYRKPGETPASRLVSFIVSILFALIGTCMSVYVWRELMEVLK